MRLLWFHAFGHEIVTKLLLRNYVGSISLFEAKNVMSWLSLVDYMGLKVQGSLIFNLNLIV
jgi:hypothetical protein